VYFIQNYCFLEEKESQRILPFNPFPFQIEIIEHLMAGDNILIHKSRRVGASWILAAWGAWLINFKKGVKVLFLSKKEDDAKALLRKVKFILNNLARHDNPDHHFATKTPWLCGQIETDNQQFFAIGYRDEQGRLVATSEAASLTTTSEAGRSEGASLIFLDEFAFVKPDDEATWTAIKPTVARGGNWVMASTGAGAGGVFHRLVMQARRGDNRSYWFRFVHWREAGITEEQFEVAADGMTEDGIAQEWEGEFIQSGNPVFNATDLAACYKPPDEYPEVAAALEDYRRNVGIYYSGVDTARGKLHRKSRLKDYHAWTSLTKTGIQAFTYCSKEELSKWAGRTETLQDGTQVNIPGTTSRLHADWPGITHIEENDAGATTINRHVTPEDGVSQVINFDTKEVTKARIINRLKLAIEGHDLIITDQFTYDCLMVYQHGDQPGQTEAPKGDYDDPVMALAMANDLRYEYGGMEFTIPLGGKRAIMTAEAQEAANIANAPVGPDVALIEPEHLRMSEMMPMPLASAPPAPYFDESMSLDLDSFLREPGRNRRGTM
jgi:hypothetical protein